MGIIHYEYNLKMKMIGNTKQCKLAVVKGGRNTHRSSLEAGIITWAGEIREGFPRMV